MLYLQPGRWISFLVEPSGNMATDAPNGIIGMGAFQHRMCNAILTWKRPFTVPKQSAGQQLPFEASVGMVLNFCDAVVVSTFVAIISRGPQSR
jgi:hypothetical protein